MSYIIQGDTGDWEVVIGLEVHAQVSSKAKLFSGSPTAFGAGPNSQVSLVDAAMPGMLPVINGYCVEQAVKTGLGLNAKINKVSVFERKNYFYADLPQGYQISQYLHPVVGEGVVTVDLADGTTRDIGIERLHMEQDAGKSMHDQDPKRSFIDLNRAGVCLMEIVTKPDIRSPEEAGAFVRKLRSILRYLGTCDGNMEQGSMRADVNVSVRKVGEDGYRTRAEIKNVNSVRFIMQAIEIEAERQVEIHESGGEIVQETRLMDPVKGETRPMRAKEFAHDYRYFPDPDLLPLELTDDFIEGLRATLPELPDAKKQRFMADFGLSAFNASVLVGDKEVAEIYEDLVGRVEKNVGLPLDKIAQEVAKFISNVLFGILNKRGLSLPEAPISPDYMATYFALMMKGVISQNAARVVYESMLDGEGSPEKIVADKGLTQITDTGAIEAAVDAAIAANPEQADEIRQGNDKAIGWFVGQIMKATQGKANPQQVNQLLREKLKS